MIYSTVGCSRMCHSDMKEIPLVLKQDKIFSVVENSFRCIFFKSEKKKKLRMMPKLTPSGTQFNANVMLPLNEHNGLFFFFFFTRMILQAFTTQQKILLNL